MQSIIAAIVAAFLLSACASSSPVISKTTSATLPAGDERGCIATYIATSGKFLYEPFLKIAAKETFSEDGKPEVWGFRVWNPEPPDSAGMTAPVNVPEEIWIPLNVFKEVPAGTTRKSIRCPPYWSAGGELNPSTVDASRRGGTRPN